MEKQIEVINELRKAIHENIVKSNETIKQTLYKEIATDMIQYLPNSSNKQIPYSSFFFKQYKTIGDFLHTPLGADKPLYNEYKEWLAWQYHDIYVDTILERMDLVNILIGDMASMQIGEKLDYIMGLDDSLSANKNDKKHVEQLLSSVEDELLYFIYNQYKKKSLGKKGYEA